MQISATAPAIMTAERGIPVQRRFLRPRPATHSLQGKHILLVPFAELSHQVCNLTPWAPLAAGHFAALHCKPTMLQMHSSTSNNKHQKQAIEDR